MKRFDQINMIPFIDIMLVLMAIVLTTASFVEVGLIDVDLPTVQQSESASLDSHYLEISINVENKLFFEGKEVNSSDLDRLLLEQDNNARVQLRVDKGAVFETFMSVIDKLKLNKFENIAIETVSQ